MTNSSRILAAVIVLSSASPLAALPSPIDYTSLSRKEGLNKKLELLSAYCRNDIEREVLELCHETVLWLHTNRGWDEVEIEDLMAHGLQESYGTLQALADGRSATRLGVVGDRLWTYHSRPSNDLLGLISWSVWQAVTPQMLHLGREYSSELAKLYKEYITDYEAGIWNFKTKMIEKDGKEKAQENYQRLVASMTEILEKHPGLNSLIAAHIIRANYDSFGPCDPRAIRSYFWLTIQKNLNPKKWLAKVRFPDDIPPTKENGWEDNNAHKRGDYGKQVLLGNDYNDRGTIFWHAAAGDEKSILQLVQAWHEDPARLRQKDYDKLKGKGSLKWAEEDPEMFRYIKGFLEE
jgi:hypothetical protein